MWGYGAMPDWLYGYLMWQFCPAGTTEQTEVHRLVLKYMLAFLTDDQRVLTPGHAITTEPNIEFFVTEKRNAKAIREDNPGIFTYFMHQPGKAHAQAFKDLMATAETDPLGSRPLDFAYRHLKGGGF
jgi:hypothetical protein